MCTISLKRVHIYKGQSPMAVGQSTLRYIIERGVNVFDWPGNSLLFYYFFNSDRGSNEHYEKEIC